MSAAASARRPASAWRPSRRSNSRARPRRRCGSPSTGTKSFPSPAIGRRRRSRSRCCLPKQGDLKALSLTAYADTGAAINSTIAALARLIYPAEAKELADFDVISNLPPGAAFRGPGGPPMAFALEQAIDEAALRMKVDPIALRKRWDPNPNRQRLYDWASGLEVWRNAKTPASQTGRYRRGVGVATGYWLYLWQPGSKVELAVKGGRLIASTAIQDIGTGSRTVIANTVAHEFGLEPHEIEVRIGDSRLPEGPGSGGSRTTASVVPPTLLAVQKLKAAIERNAKRPPIPGSNAPWRELIAASPDLSASGGAAGGRQADGAGNPLAAEGGRLHGHDFRLDDAPLLQPGDRRRRAELGAGDRGGSRYLARPCPRAQRSHRHCRRQDRSARAGAQPGGGLGDPGHRLCALRSARNRFPAPATSSPAGWRTTASPASPTRPPSTCISTKAGFDHVLGGSVGIGEVATVPTSPAIANAIRNAIGIRLTEIPIRPDRLIAALKGRAAA